jgi:hypothetical protein
VAGAAPDVVGSLAGEAAGVSPGAALGADLTSGATANLEAAGIGAGADTTATGLSGVAASAANPAATLAQSATPAAGDLNLFGTASQQVAGGTGGTWDLSGAGTATGTGNLAATGTGVPFPTGPGTTAASPLTTSATQNLNAMGIAGGVGDTTVGTAPVTGGAGIGNTLDSIVKYVGQNPILGLGLLQTAGSFLQGAGNQLTPAQANAANAQAAANQAIANLTNQQRSNMAQPKAVATLPQVTGTPQPILSQGQFGLINQAPSTFLPITPAPA